MSDYSGYAVWSSYGGDFILGTKIYMTGKGVKSIFKLIGRGVDRCYISCDDGKRMEKKKI